MSASPKMRCPCGWEDLSEELRVICVFQATPEEPAEYESICPTCDRPYDELEEVPICTECGDVYVQEDGDACGDCFEAELTEALGFNDALGG